MCCQLCVSVSCEPLGMVRRETCSPRVCPERSTPPCSVALHTLCLRGVSASEDKNMQKRQRVSGKSTNLGSTLRPVKGTEGRTGLIPASSTSGFSTGELAFVGTIRSTAALKNFRRFVFLMHSPACITDEICRSV